MDLLFRLVHSALRHQKMDVDAVPVFEDLPPDILRARHCITNWLSSNMLRELGSNSQLRAVAEVDGSADAEEKFVRLWHIHFGAGHT